MVRGHDWSGGDADGEGEGIVTKVKKIEIMRDARNYSFQLFNKKQI